ncbi:FACT complex subunit SPT16 [Striga hermonthica]|uniref:FACT complex subunit n=1 Tax=Striga hermonthica TaxID=68872 RepID=A0A9N7P0D6_STRHE|nr:FACT complex subunit SPT16 [Striga hermonthica]
MVKAGDANGVVGWSTRFASRGRTGCGLKPRLSARTGRRQGKTSMNGAFTRNNGGEIFFFLMSPRASYLISIIICSVESRYNSYCSNIARTYLIDSDVVQSKAYKVLLWAHEATILAVRPGKKARVVYEAALSVVKIDDPDFLPNLKKSTGTSISLEFRESGLSLDAENEKNFSTLLPDTVLVTDGGRDVATTASSKLFKDVAYSFNEEDDVDEPLRKKPKSDSNAEEKEFMSSKATLRSNNGELSKEELRKQHQAKLARRKNEETARRLTRVELGNVDQKNESILIPIYGCMVPFHVSNVKTATSQQDTNRSCYVRIVFNLPGPTHQRAVYLKEVAFWSKDSNEVVKLIKTLRRDVMARETEEHNF